jgi:hypothetical protein
LETKSIKILIPRRIQCRRWCSSAIRAKIGRPRTLTGQELPSKGFWVTDAGDTIFLDDADAPMSPTPINGLFATGNYKVTITGGTGRFAAASGTIVFSGAADFSYPTNPRGILRYQGTICFAQPEH